MGFLDFVSPIISGAAAGYKIFDSIRKDNQADELARTNKRPVYKAPKEIDDVYNMAVSELDDTSAKDYASQQLDQSLYGGIDAVLKSGGKADFGVINGTYGTQMRAALNQIKKDRDAKVASVNNAAYNKAKAADAEFSYNKDAPFKDKKQQEAVLRQQAEQSKADVFSLASGAISNAAIANTKPGQYGGEQDTRPIAPRLPFNNDLLPINIPQRQASPTLATSGNRNPNVYTGIDGRNVVGVNEFGELIFE